MTAIRVDYPGRKIVLSSAFEKKAFIPGTDEYDALQAVRAAHPGFTLAARQFKKNAKQEHYRGLTYDFMREYISRHETDSKPVLAELDEMIGISKGHSLGKRYPTIKAWFLERYPAYAKFGMTDDELAKWEERKAAAASNSEAEKKEQAAPAPESANVTEFPASEQENGQKESA